MQHAGPATRSGARRVARSRSLRRRPRPRRARPPASSTNGVKMPIAFEPPPTQATTRVRQAAGGSRICPRASSPMTRWRSRTKLRVRRRADARADDVVGVATFVIQSRIASLVASLSVRAAGINRRDLGAEQTHPLDVRAPGGACPRRPCRRRTRARSARRPWRSRRRAGRRRSRRRSAACRSAARAAPGRARC